MISYVRCPAAPPPSGPPHTHTRLRRASQYPTFEAHSITYTGVYHHPNPKPLTPTVQPSSLTEPLPQAQLAREVQQRSLQGLELASLQAEAQALAAKVSQQTTELLKASTRSPSR